ncbi:MAG TPA: HAMP domain-containing sensor histidine kinase [Terricaulis sp.]|nr:HAMP domain-containing sensor histidine kinase [Terricaulis sp.]
MADPSAPRPSSSPWRAARAFVDSLAGRLLGLTLAAVMAGEAFIFAPALATFHETWLRERMNLSQIAALTLEGSPDQAIAESLEYELLTNAGVLRAALQREGERVLLLESAETPPASRLVTYDYTTASPIEKFLWAFETWLGPDGRVLQVRARPRFESGQFIEIVLHERALKRAMNNFARSFALLSTLIMMAAGGMLYFALTMLFVRPMYDLTRGIERFRDRPEDVSIAFPRSARADEIGRAQRAAADMAEQVRTALKQRERLAALGAAVARIGHDLRNMLSTAQLVADRLGRSEDPDVRRLAPRLERTIDRAAGLAASTLKYGRVDEKPPELTRVAIAPALEEAVGEALVGFEGVKARLEVEPGLAAIADAEHLHRILDNLTRNAAQAMLAHTRRDKTLIVRAGRTEGRCEIDLIDHGPGVRENLRARLFEPFVSAAPEAGGTGLGLAISRELARAMGGELELIRTGAEGSTFRITLPAG